MLFKKKSRNYPQQESSTLFAKTKFLDQAKLETPTNSKSKPFIMRIEPLETKIIQFNWNQTLTSNLKTQNQLKIQLTLFTIFWTEVTI